MALQRWFAGNFFAPPLQPATMQNNEMHTHLSSKVAGGLHGEAGNVQCCLIQMAWNKTCHTEVVTHAYSTGHTATRQSPHMLTAPPAARLALATAAMHPQQTHDSQQQDTPRLHLAATSHGMVLSLARFCVQAFFAMAADKLPHACLTTVHSDMAWRHD
jgi:hypothetical protein